MEQRLSLITLGVEDLARSLAFYRDGLGWQPSPASAGDVAFFQLGGIALGLYPRTLLGEDAGLDASGSGFPRFTLAHNVRRKEEVAELLARAEQAGARLLKPAQDTFWGGHHGYFADPDGFAWEVAWNPGFPLDEAGNIQLP